MNKFYFGYQDQNEVETCLEAGVKSEHYDLAFAEENRDSTFKCPQTGEIFFGKGSVSAEKVYAIAMRKRADDAAKLANQLKTQKDEMKNFNLELGAYRDTPNLKVMGKDDINGFLDEQIV